MPELPIVAGAVDDDNEPTKSSHRRRYSENAIQLIESRLGAAAKAMYLGPEPQGLKRTVSEGPKADRRGSGGGEH